MMRRPRSPRPPAIATTVMVRDTPGELRRVFRNDGENRAMLLEILTLQGSYCWCKLGEVSGQEIWVPVFAPSSESLFSDSSSWHTGPDLAPLLGLKVPLGFRSIRAYYGILKQYYCTLTSSSFRLLHPTYRFRKTASLGFGFTDASSASTFPPRPLRPCLACSISTRNLKIPVRVVENDL